MIQKLIFIKKINLQVWYSRLRKIILIECEKNVSSFQLLSIRTVNQSVTELLRLILATESIKITEWSDIAIHVRRFFEVILFYATYHYLKLVMYLALYSANNSYYEEVIWWWDWNHILNLFFSILTISTQRSWKMVSIINDNSSSRLNWQDILID